MAFQKTPFSGSVINYETPCTSSEGRLCNIFGDISLWNEHFWQVGLQLKEFFPGQLSLVEIRHADVHPKLFEAEEAAMLLRRLLSHHGCVVSVHLNDHVFSGHHELMCEALEDSPYLRKLKLCRLDLTTDASQSLIEVLPHLNQLQELELNDVTFDRTLPECLCELLTTTRSLTTLIMTDQRIMGEDAVVVLGGLMKNVTISKLSLHTTLLSTDSSRSREDFAQYLKSNKTLRILTMTSSSDLCFFDLHPIIEALFYNNILSELNLIGCTLDTLNNEIIAEMVSRNGGLRMFHMDNCIFNEHDPHMNTRVPVFGSGLSLIRLWLAALEKNNTLEELTLDLSWIKPEDCKSFFGAVASKTSLKKVNVPTFRQDDAAQIFRAVQDTRVPQRFFIGQHHVCRDTAAALAECKALSSIGLSRVTSDEVEPLHTALHLLPTCSHLKSLCLEMSGPTFSGKVSSMLAQYVTETMALRELRLELSSRTQRSVDHSEWTLLQALSRNKSIRRLSLKGICIIQGEAQILADTLQSSRTLCSLSFYPRDIDATTWLIRMLSPNISSNYMLLDMRTHRLWLSGGLYPIQDVVRRNNSLVTRAAHFVTGKKHKYCASAAELMQFNPGLVEKVQELAPVDENEAVSLINQSLEKLSELDGFMRAAGVVKYGVTCHSRDDGQKQLADLSLHSWLPIRRYLKVSDILDPM